MSIIKRKRLKIAEEDKGSYIVYMSGVDTILAKANPLKLKEAITSKAES